MDAVDLSQDYMNRSIEAALAQLPAGTLYAVAYLDPGRSDVPVVTGNTIPAALLEVPDEFIADCGYLVAAQVQVDGAKVWGCVRTQNLQSWFQPKALSDLAKYAGRKVESKLAVSMSRHPAGTKMSA